MRVLVNDYEWSVAKKDGKWVAHSWLLGVFLHEATYKELLERVTEIVKYTDEEESRRTCESE